MEPKKLYKIYYITSNTVNSSSKVISFLINNRKTYIKEKYVTCETVYCTEDFQLDIDNTLMIKYIILSEA